MMSSPSPAVDGALVELSVVGIVERSLPSDGGEAALVGWSDATTRFGVAGADAFAIRFAPGARRCARPGRRPTSRWSER